LTGCTFAPKTGRPPKEDAAPKQPFSDRLYRQRDGKYAQVRPPCNAWIPSSLHYAGIAPLRKPTIWHDIYEKPIYRITLKGVVCGVTNMHAAADWEPCFRKCQPMGPTHQPTL